MALNDAHQGYYYQDILSAYYVAQALALGKTTTEFLFDQKKTSSEQDKFDDLSIIADDGSSYIQVKYSNQKNSHVFSKDDIAAKGSYDLALHDLFKSWQELSSPGTIFRLCLAWELPTDTVVNILTKVDKSYCTLPETTCYTVNLSDLWDEPTGVLPRWVSLKNAALTIDREEFGRFLDDLIIEVSCPKTQMLGDFSDGLDRIILGMVRKIGIGEYPNNHITPHDVVHTLCAITRRYRAQDQITPVTAGEIAIQANIRLSYGGVQQIFPVDSSKLVDTPYRVNAVLKALEKNSCVVLTGEPGAGKSWFIQNLENELEDDVEVVKHYCYTALKDPLGKKRITVNVMYGSLIEQLLKTDDELSHHKVNTYASNLSELNILLQNIKKKTLIIVDGIDHIWRVYQRNSGGLTESETAIIEALSLLDLSNPNVNLLVISQPIPKLSVLKNSTTLELLKVTQEFIERLLDNHKVENIQYEATTLAQAITRKSEGNALYAKYLVEESSPYTHVEDLSWLDTLPQYSFNLTEYYQYLYSQIQEVYTVPYALCGTAFSLSILELTQITHQGESVVQAQVWRLLPVLKYYPVNDGYMIYHESFKRFVVEKIINSGSSVKHLVYLPIIYWLEQKDFFTSLKAYTHLLKLYYEVEDYQSLNNFITTDFVSRSLIHAHPVPVLAQNFRLLRKSLSYIPDLRKTIMVCELSKAITELPNLSQSYYEYLMAVKQLQGREAVYTVLWYEDKTIGEESDLRSLLIDEAYEAQPNIPWSIFPPVERIRYDNLSYETVKMLSLKQYDRLERVFKRGVSNEKLKDGLALIITQLQEWTYAFGNDWIDQVPSYRDYLKTISSTQVDLAAAIEILLTAENVDLRENWKQIFLDVRLGVQQAVANLNEATINQAITKLASINWFHNWVIFVILTTRLEKTSHTNRDLEEAFSYLVRDMEPYKGNPRLIDLYTQIPFIQKSFKKGLDLCTDDATTKNCVGYLEKLTETTTTLSNSASGPLTTEAYLEIVQAYLPGDTALKKYEDYYKPLGSRRFYYEMASTAFKYSVVLSKNNHPCRAQSIFEQGVQYLTAYIHRKDPSMGEVIFPSAEYQKTYGTLSAEWFMEVYQLAFTVVAHTDGKGTHHYPITWFEKFFDVHPQEAIKFLICETFEASKATYHQESQFHHLLEHDNGFLDATKWFLLIKTLPIASSENILNLALDRIERISPDLKSTYVRWVKTLPELSGTERYSSYSQVTVDRYAQVFSEKIAASIEAKAPSSYSDFESEPSTIPFPTKSLEDSFAYIENTSYNEAQLKNIRIMFLNLPDEADRKQLMCKLASRYVSGRNKDEWLGTVFKQGSDEWLYMKVAMFVYFTDGWFEGLMFTQHLETAYSHDSEKTLTYLEELVGRYIGEGGNILSVPRNLIKALTVLRVEEFKVRPLLDLTKQLLKYRLPNISNCEVDQNLLKGLHEFSPEELIVALLIARLKTLTSAKSQGVVYGLTYIASHNKEALLKPVSWALSRPELLLPLHRGVLLQLLSEYFRKDELPDSLLAVLISNYPTGYFFEDRYVYDFLEGTLNQPKAPLVVAYPHHAYDLTFLEGIHPKYDFIQRVGIDTSGIFLAFKHKREELDKGVARDYSMQSHKVMPAIVPTSDALYSVVNRALYGPLWEIASIFPSPYFQHQDFLLSEIALHVGSHGPKPDYAPNMNTETEDFTATQLYPSNTDQEWITLSSMETKVTGDAFGEKEHHILETTIYVGDTRPDGMYYARTRPTIDEFRSRDPYRPEMPISRIHIFENFEKLTILFLSPYALAGLKLIISSELHNGLHAVNEAGEKVVVFTSWKEQYEGSISDGTEYPFLEGCCVQIRGDYFERLTRFYDKPFWRTTNVHKR
jgi:hypothetical protein